MDEPSPRTLVLLASSAGLVWLAGGLLLGWVAGFYLMLAVPFLGLTHRAVRLARQEQDLWWVVVAMALPAVVIIASALAMA